MPTPFGSPLAKETDNQDALQPLSLSHQSLSTNRTLTNRLLPARLYLPGRMVIGSTAEFIIKGRPGYWVALAMADKDKGAKQIYNHEIHLGPDRKVVSLGKIPEGGVLSLVIDTPIQGDLIGDPWYFEAAIWSKLDFSDTELATPVPSESAGAGPSPAVAPASSKSSGPGSPPASLSLSNGYPNGVIVAGEPVHKRGVRIVPEGMMPMTQIQRNSIDSGRP